MEVCFRISIIDKRLITFLLQANYASFLFLTTVCCLLTTIQRCRIEILHQASMPASIRIMPAMHYLFLRSRLRNAYYRTRMIYSRLSNNVVSLGSIKKISGAVDFDKFLNDPEPVKLRYITEFQEYYGPVANLRSSIEKRLGDKYKNKSGWLFEGYCQCCEKDALFLADWRYSDGSVPNYR